MNDRIFSSRIFVTGVFVASMTIGLFKIHSQGSVYQLVNDLSMVNHWPGVDGQIGTSDDVVSSDPSSTNGSTPNLNGALSYNAFDFGQGTVPDANLFPPGRQAITFLDATSTVNIDESIALSGSESRSLFLGWDVSGSEPFPGHGDYSAQITAENSGSYNPETHFFTQNIDFTANLLSGQANSSNFDLTGTAYVIAAEDFEAGTGNEYVDTVLIPIAQAKNAARMFFAMGSGTVPAADNFGFGQMNITAILFALKGTRQVEPEPVSLSIDLNGDGGVTISWPFSAGVFSLESLSGISSNSDWFLHEPPYDVIDDHASVTLPASDPIRIFRLIH